MKEENWGEKNEIFCSQGKKMNLVQNIHPCWSVNYTWMRCIITTYYSLSQKLLLNLNVWSLSKLFNKKSLEGTIIGDVDQVNVHCLIPSDPLQIHTMNIYFQFTWKINASVGASESLLKCTYYEAWYCILWRGRVYLFTYILLIIFQKSFILTRYLL